MHFWWCTLMPKDICQNVFFFFIFYTLSSMFWIVSYFSIQINVCTYLNSIKLCLRQHSHWVHKKSSSLFVQNFFVEPTLFDLSKDCFDKPKDQNSKFALRWTLILNLHLRVIRFCGWLQFAELCPGHNFRGPICPCSRKKSRRHNYICSLCIQPNSRYCILFSDNTVKIVFPKHTADCLLYFWFSPLSHNKKFVPDSRYPWGLFVVPQ